jgi:hypothetical protein
VTQDIFVESTTFQRNNVPGGTDVTIVPFGNCKEQPLQGGVGSGIVVVDIVVATLVVLVIVVGAVVVIDGHAIIVSEEE